MEYLKTVRFTLRGLTMSVAHQTQDYGKRITETLDYYYNWAAERGWRLVHVMGVKDANTVFMVTEERGDQRAMAVDEVLTVVWKADAERRTPDYLAEHPAPDLAGFLAYIEGAGWELDEDRDGYGNGVAYVSGTQLSQLTDLDLVRKEYREILAELVAAGGY